MLNNYFIIFLILIFFTKFTFGNEPTDIWSLEEKEKSSEENVANDDTSSEIENKKIKINAGITDNIKVSEENFTDKNDLVVGIYDPGKYGFELDMWTKSDGKKIYELKKKMYLAMVTVNILEGLRFYVSFACSFAFGELKLLEGSAKIISFIARDESQHLAMSQRIINNYRSYEKDKVMDKVIKDTEEEVYRLYDEAVQEEKRWATYLFSKGSMIGLSEKLLHQYVEYIANRRLKALGFDTIFDAPVNTNPLPWTQHWLSSSGLQVAPQETEVESYVIGGIKQDVDKDSLKGFSL